MILQQFGQVWWNVFKVGWIIMILRTFIVLNGIIVDSDRLFNKLCVRNQQSQNEMRIVC